VAVGEMATTAGTSSHEWVGAERLKRLSRRDAAATTRRDC
jgi:hypothetical protein